MGIPVNDNPVLQAISLQTEIQKTGFEAICGRLDIQTATLQRIVRLIEQVIQPKAEVKSVVLTKEDQDMSTGSDLVTFEVHVDALGPLTITQTRRLDWSLDGVAQPSATIDKAGTVFTGLQGQHGQVLSGTVTNLDDDGKGVASDPFTMKIGHFLQPEKSTGVAVVLISEVITQPTVLPTVNPTPVVVTDPAVPPAPSPPPTI